MRWVTSASAPAGAAKPAHSAAAASIGTVTANRFLDRPFIAILLGLGAASGEYYPRSGRVAQAPAMLSAVVQLDAGMGRKPVEDHHRRQRHDPDREIAERHILRRDGGAGVPDQAEVNDQRHQADPEA